MNAARAGRLEVADASTALSLFGVSVADAVAYARADTSDHWGRL